jgi:hypothetical protein
MMFAASHILRSDIVTIGFIAMRKGRLSRPFEALEKLAA